MYARALGSLGVVYRHLGDDEKALDYYGQQLRLAQKVDDKESIADAYTNSGGIYIARENWPLAFESEQKALAMREEMNDKEGMIPCLINMANVLDSQKKHKEALDYVLRANALAAETGAVVYLEDGEQVLASIYEGMGDYKSALAHYDRYVIIKDSLFNDEKIREVLRVSVNYEYEKKEAAARQEREKKEAVAEAVRKKQQVVIWALGALAVLVLIISVLLFRQARFRARQRTMQLEQQLLRSQMNPHFIFNSLTAIESFIYKNEPKEAGRYLSGFARLMRLILENSREEYVSLSSEVQALTNYLELQKLRFASAFDYTIELSPDVEPDLTMIPPMLAQPFIENAIEHGLRNTSEKGRIAIRFFLKGHDLVFEVQDNGTGFEAAAAQGDSHKGHRSLATTITRQRLENLNRKRKRITMVMEDVKDSKGMVTGARVTFTLPFSKA
jgi:LytS/YehU family sensor histidine kinase